MPEDLIRYEALVLDALRGVVRSVLQRVLKRGVPGDHHFFITFDTRAPGVGLSKRLKEQYPQEMTIVLQHQFWDLTMDREAGLISVGLSFGGVPASLVIPLGAVTGFADPHVRFGLQFGSDGAANDAEPEDEAPPEAAETAEPEAEAAGEAKPPAHQVVSLDAFRRRPAKE